MGDSNGADACGADLSLDHHARIVRRLLGVPVALVSVVEPRRQVFRGASGLDEPWRSRRETPLSHSLCQHVVRHGTALVVTDARTDARVRESLAVTELQVVAYAGWPLRDASGRTIGSLAAIDAEPRSWTDEDLDLLADLAQACQAELRTAEREAKATEHLIRTVFGAVDVALSFYDPEGRLLLANDMAWRTAELAGYRPDTAPWAGQEVREADNLTLVPPDKQIVPRALRGELVEATLTWVGPRGRQVALAAACRPVLHPDGSARGTLVVAHDVTRLARALQLKEDFLATVSHELRTPLTSIIGYLELLTETLETGDATALPATLKVIGRNARNLERRVGELISSASHRSVPRLRRTEVGDLVMGVADTLTARALAAEVGLSVECPRAEWAKLDAERVEQAVENLVANALTYTEREGRVVLTVSGTSDGVRIEVRDTGAGMTQDEVAQACELFWRAESTHRSAVRGLGIGLAFVRDTVEAHAGSLDIRSRPGDGTTVTLTFPRDPGTLRPAVETSSVARAT